MKNKTSQVLIRISIVALFSALGFVCTAFLMIPYGNGGYFNFGDAITVLVSIFVGPLEGALVGVISGSFSDLFIGAFNYLPFTILAKGLLGLASGLGYYFFKNKIVRFIFPVLGGILMAASYIYPNYVLYANTWYIYTAFDLIQGLFAAIIAMIVNEILLKYKADKFLN
jgi:uncharacterized membrane protein